MLEEIGSWLRSTNGAGKYWVRLAQCWILSYNEICCQSNVKTVQSKTLRLFLLHANGALHSYRHVGIRNNFHDEVFQVTSPEHHQYPCYMHFCDHWNAFLNLPWTWNLGQQLRARDQTSFWGTERSDREPKIQWVGGSGSVTELLLARKLCYEWESCHVRETKCHRMFF